MHAYRLSQRIWCEIQHAVGIKSTDCVAARIHPRIVLNDSFHAKTPGKSSTDRDKKGSNTKTELLYINGSGTESDLIYSINSNAFNCSTVHQLSRIIRVFLFHFKIAFAGDIGSVVDIVEEYDLEIRPTHFSGFFKAITSVYYSYIKRYKASTFKSLILMITLAKHFLKHPFFLLLIIPVKL